MDFLLAKVAYSLMVAFFPSSINAFFSVSSLHTMDIPLFTVVYSLKLTFPINNPIITLLICSQSSVLVWQERPSLTSVALTAVVPS